MIALKSIFRKVKEYDLRSQKKKNECLPIIKTKNCRESNKRNILKFALTMIYPSDRNSRGDEKVGTGVIPKLNAIKNMYYENHMIK